jgi:hypothetical protein
MSIRDRCDDANIPLALDAIPAVRAVEAPPDQDEENDRHDTVSLRLFLNAVFSHSVCM